MNAKTKHYLDKEKEKIQEILAFVEKNKIILGTSEYDSFYALLNDLVSLEAKVNDVDYSSEEASSIHFIIMPLKSDSTSGLCYKNIYLNEDGRFVRGTVDIIVNTNTHYFEELMSDKPELRQHAVKKIIKTIYHEFAHFLQSKSFVTHLSNDRALRNAKEFIYIEGRHGTNRIYNDNHDNFAIENDADLHSQTRFSYVLDDCYDSKRKLSYLSKYYSSDLLIPDGDRNLIVSRDDVINNYVDYLIVKNKMKFLLMKYPVLQKEYTFQCKRKTFVELAYKYDSEIKSLLSDLKLEDDKRKSLIRDTKDMYFSLFNRTIVNTSKEEIEEVVKLLGIGFFEEVIEHNIKTNNEEIELIHDYYFSRNNKSSKFNYIRLNTKAYFASYEGDKTYMCSFSEMRKKINFDSYTPEEQQKIDTYFIAHIPLCGYILSKNNELMLPQEFFKKYFLPNMKSLNSIDDFFTFLEKYTETENSLMYEIGKRRVINNGQKQNSYWNKIIMEHKGEMKL